MVIKVKGISSDMKTFEVSLDGSFSNTFQLNGKNDLKIATGCDIYKDAFHVSEPKKKTKTEKQIEEDSDEEDELDAGNKIKNKEGIEKIVSELFSVEESGWEKKLNKIMTDIETLNEAAHTEIVFERKKIKEQRLSCCIYYHESGLGPDKVSFDTKLINLDTAAQLIDPGPGSGSFPFPKEGEIIEFDKSFMNKFGFEGEWRWKAETMRGENDRKQRFLYTIETHLPFKAPSVLSGKIDAFQEYIKGNATKNQYINELEVKKKTVDEKAYKLVEYKELGDAMQNATYIAWHKYCERKYKTSTELYVGENYNTSYLHSDTVSDINTFLSLYTVMLTTDHPVHCRNVLFGVPSVYSGGRNKCSTNRRFVPLIDPTERKKEQILRELKLVENCNNNLKVRWNKALIEKNIFIKIQKRSNKDFEFRITEELRNTPISIAIQEFLDTMNKEARDNAEKLRMDDSIMDPLLVTSYIETYIQKYMCSDLIQVRVNKKNENKVKQYIDGVFLQQIENNMTFNEEINNYIRSINSFIESKKKPATFLSLRGGVGSNRRRSRRRSRSRETFRNRSRNMSATFLTMNEKMILFLIHKYYLTERNSSHSRRSYSNWNPVSIENSFYSIYCDVIWKMQMTKNKERGRSLLTEEQRGFNRINNATYDTIRDLVYRNERFRFTVPKLRSLPSSSQIHSSFMMSIYVFIQNMLSIVQDYDDVAANTNFLVQTRNPVVDENPIIQDQVPLLNPTKLQEKGFQQQTKKRAWMDIFNRPQAKDSLSEESVASERAESRIRNNRTKRIRRIRI